MNKVHELRARKTYSGLNESEQDSLRNSNPEMTDLKLEKAGLIKNGQLQMEKFQSSKFILRNSARKFLEVSCDLDKSTAQPKVIFRSDSNKKEFHLADFEVGHLFKMSKGNIIAGGFEEIITINQYYILNGENMDVTIWEIK